MPTTPEPSCLQDITKTHTSFLNRELIPEHYRFLHKDNSAKIEREYDDLEASFILSEN